MVRNSGLSKETEQFSFIRTIAVFSHSKTDKKTSSREARNVLSQQDDNATKNRLKANSDRHNSALCTTNNIEDSIGNIEEKPCTVSDGWYSDNTSDDIDIPTVIVVPESDRSNNSSLSQKPGFGYYLDRILLLGAGSYLCFILWWLFIAKNALFPLSFLPRQNTISSADAEFISYVEQSLEKIDRQLARQKSVSESENLTEDNTSQVTYVPVYTPTPPKIPQNQLLFPPPPPQSSATQTIPIVPIDPPAAPSESIEIKTIPAEADSDGQIAKTNSAKATSETAAAVKPKINYTLVGVMELKEGSAALFKVNGVTQRIWLGEEIENTGWVLQSVANQKITMTRQGKSLTLSVGENF